MIFCAVSPRRCSRFATNFADLAEQRRVVVATCVPRSRRAMAAIARCWRSPDGRHGDMHQPVADALGHVGGLKPCSRASKRNTVSGQSASRRIMAVCDPPGAKNLIARDSRSLPSNVTTWPVTNLSLMAG